MFELILFYTFSLILLVAAIAVVTVRNTVYAALMLILAFFTSAALWLLLQAEFLGIVLVLVYVGAVMVLFLFVIMMLEVNQSAVRERFTQYMPVGALVFLVIVAEIIFVYTHKSFLSSPQPNPDLGINNTEKLGIALYGDHIYALEITALILLVAIVAAILLTLNRKRPQKRQDIEQQIRTQRNDRVRLVPMKAERSKS